ncbi:MAG: murein L,D-transpeptidase catalytic domain family protein [Cyclobacteriaceae bacterium]
MKIFFLSLLLGIPAVQNTHSHKALDHSLEVRFSSNKPGLVATENLYDQLELEQAGLPQSVFSKAFLGFQNLKSNDKLSARQLLTIIDFDQSANQDRLWIIDLDNQILLQKTLVAHGRNSGELYARQFSNHVNSYKSSLGFYITGKTYNGKHGLSLRLHGMEPGINDQAEARAIVMHGADYVSKDFIKRNGRLGRSYGCPAVPKALAPRIISAVAGGTCLFIHHSDREYQSNSTLLRIRTQG